MEPASRVVGTLRLPDGILAPEDLVRGAWPAAAGARIAAHGRVLKMVRSRLVVEVDDDVWRSQLFSLRQQILNNLEKRLGRRWVEEIEFRAAARPRAALEARGPGRASASIRSADDASGIADPGLRRIYQAARKKALA